MEDIKARDDNQTPLSHCYLSVRTFKIFMLLSKRSVISQAIITEAIKSASDNHLVQRFKEQAAQGEGSHEVVSPFAGSQADPQVTSKTCKFCWLGHSSQFHTRTDAVHAAPHACKGS